MIIDASTRAAVAVMANDLSQEPHGWHHPRDHLLQTNPYMGNTTISNIRIMHPHNTPPTLRLPATSVRNNPDQATGSKMSSSSRPSIPSIPNLRTMEDFISLLPARLMENKSRC